MSDPSFLVTRPTAATPRSRRRAASPTTSLFPTPNLSAPIDWRTERPRYRDRMLATLESRGYEGFGDGIEVEHLTTPLDWQARGMEQGAPFAAAHTFVQTGPFRPRKPGGRERRLRRQRHPARSGRADGPGARTARRRAHHRARPSYRSRAWR